MNVAIYARVSSDRQDMDLSISAQLRVLREYAEREDIHISTKSIDSVIVRLKARGILLEPLRPKKAAKWCRERL